NQKIQQFDLRYYYSGGLNAERMLLEEVKQEGFQPYKFYYHGITLPNRNSFATDHWGYYTNPGNNPTTYGIPALTYQGRFYSGISKDADFSGTRAQSLHKIQFPSGAATEYVYEFNTYTDPATNTTKTGAGLRIKEIVTSTSRWNGEEISRKRYVYEEGKISQNFPPRYAKKISFKEEVIAATRRASFLHRSSQPFNMASLTLDNAVLYQKVRKLNEGEGDNGQTVYEFIGFQERPDVAAPKYRIDEDRPTEITQSNWSATAPYLPDSPRHWERGLLKKMSVYDRDDRLRSTTTYTYDFDRTKDKKVYGIDLYYDAVNSEDNRGRIAFLSYLYYGKYEEESRWVALTRTAERTYDLAGNNYVETITDYEYKDNTELKRIKNYDGKGNTYETTYRYVDDYMAVVDGSAMIRALDLMRKRFMFGVPIEKRTTIQKGSNAPARLLESTLHLYQLNTNSSFKDYIKYPYNEDGEFGIENTAVLKEVLHFKSKKPAADVPSVSISGG
ncbi:MAG: hypothetical protein AAF734_09950, partial [Bacteroidota bacterium]